MLTGKHPFHVESDTERQFIHRISKEDIASRLSNNLEYYEISKLAKSFLKCLLARAISDRYRVYQALAHPWITRQLGDPVPLT
jgi:serine/threonine protein kinase